MFAGGLAQELGNGVAARVVGLRPQLSLAFRLGGELEDGEAFLDGLDDLQLVQRLGIDGGGIGREGGLPLSAEQLEQPISDCVYSMKAKPLVWVGSAKADLVGFPDEARREAGHDLWLVQQGASPRDWRPMSDVGAGVVEIRVHAGTEHRVLCREVR